MYHNRVKGGYTMSHNHITANNMHYHYGIYKIFFLGGIGKIWQQSKKNDSMNSTQSI